MKEEAETSVIFLKSPVKCFIQEENIKHMAISEHQQCAFVVRTGDSVTAGSHLEKQIVVYSVNLRGEVKREKRSLPHWVRVPWAFCINKAIGFVLFTR